MTNFYTDIILTVGVSLIGGALFGLEIGFRIFVIGLGVDFVILAINIFQGRKH
jgi:hypothetical protein